MYASSKQVETDAALARAFQEEEFHAGRAPKPPPLGPSFDATPLHDQVSNDWTAVLQNQAETLRERVQQVQASRGAGQRQSDAELAQNLQAEELGVVGTINAPPSQQKDVELARGLQAQELEAAQNSEAPVDWTLLSKLQVKPKPEVYSPSTSSVQATSETSIFQQSNSEISRAADGLEGFSMKSEPGSVGPGTPVAKETVAPEGFFDGIRTDPKIVPVMSPEELEESTSWSHSDEGSPLHDSFTSFDGPVGAKLRHMKSIPVEGKVTKEHVLRTNSFVPTWDEKSSSEDHELLVDRLKAYGLAERHVAGDGNCQFHALSDQLYQTPEKHEHVRRAVCKQLKHHPELYEAYVSDEDYKHYVRRMTKDGEWGDHITLQAAADRYGLKISLLTNFKDNGFIQIDPREPQSQRVLYLSFWADVHYNSVYPASDMPPPEPTKHRNPLRKFIHNILQ